MNFKYLLTSIFVIVAMMFFQHCQHENSQQRGMTKEEREEALVKANKGLVSRDSAQILGVVRAKGWEMQTTGTGLWYQIIEQGNGRKAKTNMIAELLYKVRLLNGKLVYSSDSTGLKSFRITKGGVERGLEEGILLLREGDSARFVMPPYMAHHLMGDQKRIPPRASIIYEVRLKSLRK
ncbi:MAG: FKBP-type peptidyl-prolyl cis-trans isomerase [Salinivirgaceae bacterium]